VVKSRWLRNQFVNRVVALTLAFEYQQSKQVVAGEDLKQDILKTGIRTLQLDTGVSHHTIGKLLRNERVRRKKLAKILRRIRIC